MKHVFVAVLEVRPLAGCQIDPSVYAGAAVRCYIPAMDETTARQLLADTLRQDCFALVEEEFFVRDDSTEWEKPDNEEATKAITEAIDSDVLVYSEFRAWDHDDPGIDKTKTGEQFGAANPGCRSC